MKLNKRTIDRAIKHLDLQIIHQRGSGYFYFVSLTTNTQVGESVGICYYDQIDLSRWVDFATYAIGEHALNPHI